MIKNNNEDGKTHYMKHYMMVDGNNGEVVISGLVIMLLMLVTQTLQIAGTTVISSVSLMMAIGAKKK